MGKRTNTWSNRNAPIRTAIAAVETGDEGDELIYVSTRRFIQVDLDGLEHALESDGVEAVLWAEALREVARS